MPFWSIRPIAGPDDPRWLDHRVWAEVVVRAESAAQARLSAADEIEADTEGRSGFDDEKLYWVRRLNEAEAAPFAGPVVLTCLQRPAA